MGDASRIKGSSKEAAMGIKYTSDLAITLSIFYLKVVGFWFANNRFQQCYRHFLVIYTAALDMYSIFIQTLGIYVCWGNFSICAYIFVDMLTATIILTKLGLMSSQKKTFFRTIEFMQKSFWHSDYDFNEKRIVDGVRKMCIYLVCTFSIFSQFTAVCYCIKPAISNIGKNDSERETIFPMWLDLPVSQTPYFEIIYIVQCLCLYQTDACYLCFDNMFCIMCLHAAGQFRILQYRIINIHKAWNPFENNENQSNNAMYSSEACYTALKDCIRQHQVLIEFCKTIDDMFRVIMMLQVLTFSVSVALSGYHVLLAEMELAARIPLIFYLLANVCQLWMFTYSCDTMTRESMNVAEAAYSTPWTNLTTDKFGNIIRQDLRIMIIRTLRPCQVTACGFFAISLETYTKILSTAMSYFTILKQSS